jgi:hypothetical protein
MPIAQVTRFSAGPSVSRNAFGNAPRTLGGIFNAPTTFTSYGTDVTADQPFPVGTTQTLGSVNFPGYSFTKGSYVRISYAGSLVFNNVGGGATGNISVLIDPNAAGTSYAFNLDGGYTAPVGLSVEFFGGEFSFFALEEPSASAAVSVSSLFTSVSNAPAAPLFSLPQGVEPGTVLLDTTGLPGGITVSLRCSLAGTGRISLIKLRYFVTEISGG